jgi:hypothetical protein
VGGVGRNLNPVGTNRLPQDFLVKTLVRAISHEKSTYLSD